MLAVNMNARDKIPQCHPQHMVYLDNLRLVSMFSTIKNLMKQTFLKVEDNTVLQNTYTFNQIIVRFMFNP